MLESGSQAWQSAGSEEVLVLGCWVVCVGGQEEVLGFARNAAACEDGVDDNSFDWYPGSCVNQLYNCPDMEEHELSGVA